MNIKTKSLFSVIISLGVAYLFFGAIIGFWVVVALEADESLYDALWRSEGLLPKMVLYAMVLLVPFVSQSIVLNKGKFNQVEIGNYLNVYMYGLVGASIMTLYEWFMEETNISDIDVVASFSIIMILIAYLASIRKQYYG